MKLVKINPLIEDEGVGAKARRLIHGSMGHLDPFVIFDEYQIFSDAYFPRHPHSGFEGFQILMEGRTIYRDNQGKEGAIDPGDVRRFVAGDGFEHSEEPDYDGTVRGYLLWIKIPRNNRNTPVIFKEERSANIPVVEKNNLKIRMIMGEQSPVKTMTPVEWDLVESGETDGTIAIELDPEYNGFIYVSSGGVENDGLLIGKGEGAIMKGSGKVNLKVLPSTEMVVVKGRKLNEPIVQEGHLVHW